MIPVDLLDRQGVAIQGVPYADRFVRAFLSGGSVRRQTPAGDPAG